MIEWTREWTPEELKALERQARDHHALLGGISTHELECQEAAYDLDLRRQQHARRFKRNHHTVRAATREAMEQYVTSQGAHPLTGDPSLYHAPVVAVAGGIAFDPTRMTNDCLEEVYLRLRGAGKVDHKVADRVLAVLRSYPTGIRVDDIVTFTGAPKTSVRRALDTLVVLGDVRLKEEPTRGKGSPRKRYFPTLKGMAGLDSALDGGVI